MEPGRGPALVRTWFLSGLLRPFPAAVGVGDELNLCLGDARALLVHLQFDDAGFVVERPSGAVLDGLADVVDVRVFASRSRGPGDAEIAFRATTVRAKTITHELGHTLEYQNPALFEEAAAFITAHTHGAKKPLREGAQPGYKYKKDEYYRPGLSEKDEAWRYATKIYPWNSGRAVSGPLDRTDLQRPRVARA